MTAAVVFGGMVMLRALQLPPKGKSPPDVPAGAQVIATVPVNMPLGVTVIGIVIVSGVVPAVAVIVPLPPDTVKLPWLVTVKVMPLLANSQDVRRVDGLQVSQEAWNH